MTDAIEDRMMQSLMRALRPILFAFEEQDVKVQTENDQILDAVARCAWREFRKQCAEAAARTKYDQGPAMASEEMTLRELLLAEQYESRIAELEAALQSVRRLCFIRSDASSNFINAVMEKIDGVLPAATTTRQEPS